MGKQTTSRSRIPRSQGNLYTWLSSFTGKDATDKQFYRGLLTILVLGLALWPALVLLYTWIKNGLPWSK